MSKVIANLDTVIAKINKVSPQISKYMKDVIQYGVREVRNEAILSIQGTPKTGRAYQRGKKIHIASSPGNPPAIDTGILINSIEMVYKDSGFTGEVQANTNYAIHLEYGTAKMAERPFMQPALETNKKKILKKAQSFKYKK